MIDFTKSLNCIEEGMFFNAPSRKYFRVDHFVHEHINKYHPKNLVVMNMGYLKAPLCVELCDLEQIELSKQSLIDCFRFNSYWENGREHLSLKIPNRIDFWLIYKVDEGVLYTANEGAKPYTLGELSPLLGTKTIDQMQSYLLSAGLAVDGNQKTTLK